MIGRRQVLRAAALLAAAGAGGAYASTEVSETLRVERVEVVLPGLLPAHDGLRIAQLSDVHVGPLTSPERIRAAVAQVRQLRPDLVALTGDYLTAHLHRVGIQPAPAQVQEQLAGLPGPAVAVLGNHDHYVDAVGAAAALERLGCRVLRNAHTTLVLRGEPFTVVGIDDLSTRHADPARARRGLSRGFHLHLAHVPWTANLLRDLGEPTLMLSGHTHGGQIDVPPISWMVGRYRAGSYRVGAVRLYVNRGVGQTWVPVRINAAPEVTLLTLWSGAAT